MRGKVDDEQKVSLQDMFQGRDLLFKKADGGNKTARDF